MKTKRKLRTRHLALDFTQPVNPLPEDRVRAGFARLKEAIISLDSQREIPILDEHKAL